MIPTKVKEWVAGEPDNAKVLSPVRWGVVAKVPVSVRPKRKGLRQVTRLEPTRWVSEAWKRRALSIIGCAIIGAGLLFLFADPLATFLLGTFQTGGGTGGGTRA